MTKTYKVSIIRSIFIIISVIIIFSCIKIISAWDPMKINSGLLLVCFVMTFFGMFAFNNILEIIRSFYYYDD